MLFETVYDGAHDHMPAVAGKPQAFHCALTQNIARLTSNVVGGVNAKEFFEPIVEIDDMLV